ncbi:MAG: glycosyltransferase [Actinomycetota bacterium]|nr:glycosyltransferase [Actinomycetota bacterium]
MEPPLVTVVVLAHNRRDELRVTLRALTEELDYPAARLETIVVDNASADGTATMVRKEFRGVELVERPRNVGIAGWNDGIRAGRGEFFLLLDDDCYLVGDSLLRAVAAAGNYTADLVSFRVRSTLNPGFVFNTAWDPGLLSFWGCAALVRRDAALALGGFDPEIFIWAHEPEFTIRLLDSGRRHLHAADIDAFHQADPHRERAPGFHRLNTRNLAYTAAKLLQPLDAARALGNLALAALLEAARDPRRAGSLPALAAGAWRGSRNRAPVRAAVSALYRANFSDFVSPFRFIRGGRVEDARARRRRFWNDRGALYPRRTAWLQL